MLAKFAKAKESYEARVSQPCPGIETLTQILVSEIDEVIQNPYNSSMIFDLPESFRANYADQGALQRIANSHVRIFNTISTQLTVKVIYTHYRKCQWSLEIYCGKKFEDDMWERNF